LALDYNLILVADKVNL